MKTFHVYLHPSRGYEAVKEGPCLPALFFNVFWLLVRGLHGPAIVFIGFGAVLAGAEVTAGRNSVDAVQAWGFRVSMVAGFLTLWLLPFLYGNQWRHADLLNRGFSHVARLAARTPDDAIARALSVDPLKGRQPGDIQAQGKEGLRELQQRQEGKSRRRKPLAEPRQQADRDDGAEPANIPRRSDAMRLPTRQPTV